MPRCLFIVLGLLCLQPLQVRAQNGPAVQVFNSGSADPRLGRIGPLMPLDHPINFVVSVNAGYDDNVNTSASHPQDSFFGDAGLGLSYAFGTLRTQGSLSTNASVTYFHNDGGGRFNYDPNLALNLAVTHQVSERLTLSGGIFARYGIEPDFATGRGENRRSGNFFNSSSSISAAYQWLERFSTVSSYSLSILRYEDDLIGIAQNRFDHSFGEQFRFLFLPVTTLVGEYRLGLSTYESANRDSNTHSLLAGVDHTLGPHVQGTFRGGVELRQSDQESSNTVNPYFDASLNCAVGEKTSVSWNAHYSTTESNVLGAASSDTFRTGVEGRYGLTPRISSTLSVFYVNETNNGADLGAFQLPSFSEDSIDVSLNLSYAVSSRFSANAGYHHTEVMSDFTDRSYSRSRYSGGVSYSF